MKRLAFAMALALVGALLAIAPASAQYGGNPPPPPPPGPPASPPVTPSGPPAGCPVQNPPPANTPPCNPRRPANVSDEHVRPGDPVTITTPPVFAPNSQTGLNMARARQGANATSLGTPTANSNGAVSQSFTVPDTPPGVYFLYVTGGDPDGNLVVSLAPLVVSGAGEAAAVQGDSVKAAAFAAPVPAAVAEVQTVAADTEAAVVEAVTQGPAGVVLSPQGQLQVRTAAGLQQADSLPRTGADDISQQVTIGAALMLAGTGLVLLRRRRGGFAK